MTISTLVTTHSMIGTPVSIGGEWSVSQLNIAVNSESDSFLTMNQCLGLIRRLVRVIRIIMRSR